MISERSCDTDQSNSCLKMCFLLYIWLDKRNLSDLAILPKPNVTHGHKTSHKCQFFEIEIYTSSESWIDKLSIDV